MSCELSGATFTDSHNEILQCDVWIIQNNRYSLPVERSCCSVFFMLQAPQMETEISLKYRCQSCCGV